MNKTANARANAMDGFDVWFFGGTPGPDDGEGVCTLKDPLLTSADEDDTGIPAFAHRCHCGKPHTKAGAAQNGAIRTHAGLAALHL